MAEQIIDQSMPPRMKDCWWGELIYGTKHQIQRLGIAQGLNFPGDADGPRLVLNSVDPRGLPVKIERYSGETFSASILFPGREARLPSFGSVEQQFAQGVVLVHEIHRDEYTGMAEALTSAGLVDSKHFPGQLGMRKLHVTINPDGTVAVGPPTGNNRYANMPGAQRISRVSKTQYRLAIVVSKHESDQRWLAFKQREDAFMRRMWALPRPAPLSAAQTIGGRFEQYLSMPAPRRELPTTWRVIVNPNPARV